MVPVLAYTGCAAHNINGSTIHALLKLGLHSETDELTPNLLETLQSKCQHIRLMIIDEKSMIGQCFLARIERRLSAIFPSRLGVLFGGIHFILMGDFAQLPPVGDISLYIRMEPHQQRDINKQMLYNRGYFLYQQFNKFIRLQINMRQAGESNDQRCFREILTYARNATWTLADWTTLQKRVLGALDNIEKVLFSGAVALMSTRKEVKIFNARKILEMDMPVYRCVAKHNVLPSIMSAVKKLPSESGGDSYPYLLLGIGVRLMITKNLWLQAGIVNGSMGTLKGIVEGNEADSLPICILVELDSYSGPPFIGLHPTVIPICPFHVHFEYKGHQCTRIHFPVVLAWGLTIHKSQGLTLKKIIVDLGEKERQSGLTFVALSRVKHLHDLAFLNFFPFTRLSCIATHKNTKDRLEEERRLEGLAI